MQNPGPRQPNRHERYTSHKPKQTGVHIHLRWYPPLTNNLFFVPVRSSQTRKMGATLFPLPRYIVYLGLHWIYSFLTTNQHQFMRQIIFHSVRSNALWGPLIGVAWTFESFVGKLECRPNFRRRQEACVWDAIMRSVPFKGPKEVGIPSFRKCL